MAIHEEVLRTARRLCRERRGWTFTAEEVVRALPDLNEGSIRTHIVSRCCVNAPRNHPHRWDYFRRVSRGVYEIRRPFRLAESSRKKKSAEVAVAEARTTYGIIGVKVFIFKGEILKKDHLETEAQAYVLEI